MSASAALLLFACQQVQVQFVPASSDLQLVVWVENAAGEVVDTLFVTDAVGRRGLGNRPGRFDFNSGFRWEAGRRVTTFPVWAHRRGVAYPMVIYQGEDESRLPAPAIQLSTESYYCRFFQTEQADLAQQCPDLSYSDKGKFSLVETSLYPPRSDLTPYPPYDHADVALYAQTNDLDAISAATPAGGTLHTIDWEIPADAPPGQYVVWAEVSREFDQNAFHDYPSPENIAFGEFGRAYRGQPSTLWRVPLTIGGAAGVTEAADYLGYGAPDGADGDLRPPDGTITTAAARIAGLRATVDMATILPAPAAPEVVAVDVTSAEIATPAAGVVLRMSTTPFTRQMFPTTGRLVSAPLLTRLEPDTHYWLAAALPDCYGAWGELAVIEFDTAPPAGCGCSTSPAGPTSWSAALVLLGLLRRRRRSVHPRTESRGRIERCAVVLWLCIAGGAVACSGSEDTPSLTIDPLYVAGDGAAVLLADGPIVLFLEDGLYVFRASAAVRGAAVEWLKIEVKVSGASREYADVRGWVHLVFDGVDSVPDVEDWLNASAMLPLCHDDRLVPVLGETLTVSVIFGEGASATAPVTYTVVPYCESTDCEIDCGALP